MKLRFRILGPFFGPRAKSDRNQPETAWIGLERPKMAQNGPKYALWVQMRGL